MSSGFVSFEDYHAMREVWGLYGNLGGLDVLTPADRSDNDLCEDMLKGRWMYCAVEGTHSTRVTCVACYNGLEHNPYRDQPFTPALRSIHEPRMTRERTKQTMTGQLIPPSQRLICQRRLSRGTPIVNVEGAKISRYPRLCYCRLRRPRDPRRHSSLFIK